MRKSIKKAMALSLAAVMAVSLAACGGGSSSGGSSSGGSGSSGGSSSGDEKVELKFSWWGGDSRHEATQKAVDAFMAKYPNIKVECEYGAWDGWTEKCATQLNGGTAPDLMQVNWNWLYQFYASSLSLLAPQEQELLFSRVEARLRPELWDGSQWVADYRRIQAKARKPAQP